MSAEPGAATEDAPASPASAPAADGLADEIVARTLAEKVLYAWLRNRYQLLFPFALDFRQLDARQSSLAIEAMLVAAQADGTFDARERERIEAALRLVAPSADASALLDAALAAPQPLSRVLGGLRGLQDAALVYAASLMAIDQRKPVNRAFLAYLAARLQLQQDLVASLEQRFRATA